MFSGKSGASRLSIVVVVGLIAIKVAVGIITGSLSIFAQAVDSFLDLFAVVITFVAVRFAARPADEDHHFGHGKAENVAAVVQAVLIIIAGGSIIYSAVRRIQAGAALEMTEAGMGVMAVSVIASIFLSRYLLRVARREDSQALAANARNIAADVYSALAVLIGLIIVRFTGWNIVDPILAVLVAFFIFKVGFDVLREAFGAIVDIKLPEEEEALIRASVSEHFGNEVVDFHKLRTRKSGSHRYIDFHLVLPKDTSLEAAHKMCDHLEEDIESKLPGTDVTIHAEPCDENCDECKAVCEKRKG
jgi:cation diffusion facilitator family transporter